MVIIVEPVKETPQLMVYSSMLASWQKGVEGEPESPHVTELQDGKEPGEGKPGGGASPAPGKPVPRNDGYKG